MSKWFFLSYELNDELSAYRNGKRITVSHLREMKLGAECNETSIDVSLHFGTHIDFPYHFLDQGMTMSDYDPDFFITDKIGLVFLDKLETKGLVSLCDIKPFVEKLPSDTECLILHTGMSGSRFDDIYWSDGIGINSGVAEYLSIVLPKLRFIGFDFISVSGTHNRRQLGRAVHRELFKKNILPIEDMYLKMLKKGDIIKKIIVSPYRITSADAAPATVFALIDKNND